MKGQNTAGIEISHIVTKVTHFCKSDSSKPRFDGAVDLDGSIQWPIAFERYRMGYCPWCGLHLPLSLPKREVKE